VTYRIAITAIEAWPALIPGGRRLARSLAVLGLVAASSGCILTKDLPDPALDIPEGYKQPTRCRRSTGGAASARGSSRS
jgi:multidrug efflux system outer membrane protein